MKQLCFHTPLEGVLPFSEYLEEQGAYSVSAFEDKKDTTRYIIQATFDQEDSNLEPILNSIANKIAIPAPMLQWSDEEREKNWVREVQDNFPPLQIGTFFIHGSHVSKEDIQEATGVAIQVDAAAAFGTGEHETTQGCLRLLTLLHEEKTPVTQALDMGCGTGILAIAAAKLWPTLPIHCIDIDAHAIEQTKRNAKINHVFNNMTFQQGDTPTLSSTGDPFDLVMANILANPLKQMAPAIAHKTTPTAKLILSGLLTKQKEEVLEAYSACGFNLERALEVNEWSCLLLRAA